MSNPYNEDLLLSFFNELSNILGHGDVRSISDVTELMYILRHLAQAQADRTQGPDGYR